MAVAGWLAVLVGILCGMIRRGQLWVFSKITVAKRATIHASVWAMTSKFVDPTSMSFRIVVLSVYQKILWQALPRSRRLFVITKCLRNDHDWAPGKPIVGSWL